MNECFFFVTQLTIFQTAVSLSLLSYACVSAPCLQCVSVQWREYDAALQPGCVFRPQPAKRGSRRRCRHSTASDKRPGEEHHRPARKHLPQPERSAGAGVWEMHDTGTGRLVRGRIVYTCDVNTNAWWNLNVGMFFFTVRPSLKKEM